MSSLDSNTPPTQAEVPSDNAVLRGKTLTFITLVGLLIVSGVTASIVGYQVKQADWERTAALRSSYQTLGGSPEILGNPRLTSADAASTPEGQAFLTVFELNERVRAFDLNRTLQNTPSERLASLPESLQKVGATEAAAIVRDTLKALQSAGEHGEAAPPTKEDEPTNDAKKISKNYNRSVVRSTQAILYRYLREVVEKRVTSTK